MANRRSQIFHECAIIVHCRIRLVDYWNEHGAAQNRRDVSINFGVTTKAISNTVSHFIWPTFAFSPLYMLTLANEIKKKQNRINFIYEINEQASCAKLFKVTSMQTHKKKCQHFVCSSGAHAGAYEKKNLRHQAYSTVRF